MTDSATLMAIQGTHARQFPDCKFPLTFVTTEVTTLYGCIHQAIIRAAAIVGCDIPELSYNQLPLRQDNPLSEAL